ncbi:MAG TPA: aminotransferase class I/II-fold pyridoxal phosphate-dependent enzyme, partial [Petrimonas sp.]|nr:aminotransferase class I/II-fold pyridoxal phosphate-dependent enzyme [Petrimonas sp.]
MKKKIYLSLAKISGHEIEYVTDAIESNWIVPLGPNVDGFEEDLERYLETDKQKVVALSSGTAAIHLALLQMGVGEGDEVICQSFTFTASANPIIYQHATPVFVDSEPDTWNMSPEHLRAAIEDRILKTGKKPKAIVIVHLFGMPAKMDEIMAIASEFGIPVLEDAAEALGAEYKGRRCGKLGDYGVLSFNGNKIITTSGGGALICPDEESAIKTKYYATQARENRPYYHHTEVGYNYRMS